MVLFGLTTALARLRTFWDSVLLFSVLVFIQNTVRYCILRWVTMHFSLSKWTQMCQCCCETKIWWRCLFVAWDAEGRTSCSDKPSSVTATRHRFPGVNSAPRSRVSTVTGPRDMSHIRASPLFWRSPVVWQVVFKISGSAGSVHGLLSSISAGSWRLLVFYSLFLFTSNWLHGIWLNSEVRISWELPLPERGSDRPYLRLAVTSWWNPH